MIEYTKRVVVVLLSMVTVACTQPTAYETDIAYSDSWFACEARFECVAVYDAFCKFVGVNKKYTLIYQDWSYQEVRSEGESAVCPSPMMHTEGAGCRKGRCVYPFGLEDYVEDPKSEE